MNDPAQSHTDTGPAQPDTAEFALSLSEVRDHPESGPVSKAVCAVSRIGPAEADLVAACLSVELLSPIDAELRGERQNAGALLVGHEISQAARDCGQDWILARHAQIPDGMSCREFILRRALERHDLSLDQRAVLAAMLKALLCTTSAASSPPDADAASTGEGACQTAAVAAMVPARLVTVAESLLANAPELADCVLAGERPLYLAVRAAEQRQEDTGPSGDGERIRAGLDTITSFFEGHLARNGVTAGDRDEVLGLLREMRGLVETRSGGEQRRGDEGNPQVHRGPETHKDVREPVDATEGPAGGDAAAG